MTSPGPNRRLCIKWLVFLAVVMTYLIVGVVFFKTQNWEQCLTQCTFNQLLPVTLLPVGLIGLSPPDNGADVGRTGSTERNLNKYEK